MNLDDLVSHVEPHVPGCPHPMMIDQLRAKVQELCDRSHFWRERLPKLDVYKGLQDYELDLPYNARLVAIHQLYWEDRALRFRSIDKVRATDGGGDDDTSSEPDWWTQPTWTIVRIYPAPDEDKTGKLEPYAALSLAEGESEFPDDLAQFARGIGHGAAAALKLMPDQPWTDRQGVQMYERNFKADMATATGIAMRGMRNIPGRAAYTELDISRGSRWL